MNITLIILRYTIRRLFTIFLLITLVVSENTAKPSIPLWSFNNDTLIFQILYSNYNNNPSYDFPVEKGIEVQFYNCGATDKNGALLLMDCMDITWRNEKTSSYGKMMEFQEDFSESSNQHLFELGIDEVSNSVFDWHYQNSYDTKLGKAIVWMKTGYKENEVSLIEIEVESDEVNFQLIGFPIIHR